MKSQKKKHSSLINFGPQTHEFLSVPTISPHLPLYQEKLSSFSSPPKMTGIQLSSHGFIQQKNFAPQLRKWIHHHNRDSLMLTIELGSYQTHLMILIQNTSSCFSNKFNISEGTYGRIYFYTENGKQFAVKSQKCEINNMFNVQSKFDQLLQQYFFYKFASALEVGPKIYQIWGYDIVCFKDTFEFIMQYCDTKYFTTKKIESIQADLYKNLKIIHSMKMVHCDLKHKNIGWSLQNKKWIFLDFGFSSFLQEQIGKKSWTKFIGTYPYVTDQMKDIFHLRTMGRIDLYYNDLFGLEKSIQKIKNCSIQKIFFLYSKEQKQHIQQKTFRLLYFHIKMYAMKYFLFMRNFESVRMLFSSIFSLRVVFLRLVLQQIQSSAQDKQHSTMLVEIFRDFKTQQYEQRFEQKLKVTNQELKCLQYLVKKIKQQQEVNYLSLEKSVFFLKEQKDARKFIRFIWGRKDFMINLFLFLDEANFSNEQDFQEKSSVITDLIINQFFPSLKEQNRFQKFFNLLYFLQEYFIQNQNYVCLQIIYNYFMIIGGSRNRKLSSMITSDKNKFRKLQNQVINFFLEADSNEFIWEEEAFKRIIQDLNFQEQERDFIQSQKNLIIKSLIQIQKISQLKMQKQEKLCLENIFKEFNSLPFRSQAYEKFLKGLYFQWKATIFQNKQAVFFYKKVVYQNKYSSLLQQKKEMYAHLINGQERKIDVVLQKNSFLKFFPNIFMISYYFRKNQGQKLQEMISNFIDLWKQDIYLQAQNLLYISNLKKESFFEKIRKILFYFRKYTLNNMEFCQIEDLWYFIKTISHNLIIKAEDNNQVRHLKQELVEIGQEILSYCQKDTLNLRKNIFIKQLQILVQYLRGNEDHAFKQFIVLYDSTYHYRKNWKGFCQIQILKSLSFYYHTLENTKHTMNLFKKIHQFYIDSDTEYRYWGYENITLLFPDTISVIICLNHDFMKAFELIKQFTLHLTKSNKKLKMIPQVLFYFTDSLKNNQSFFSRSFIKKQIKHQSLKNVRQNNYLSALICMILCSFQSILDIQQIKRFVKLSIANINRYQDSQRINLRRQLLKKCTIFLDPKKKRKYFLFYKKHLFTLSSSFNSLQQKLERKVIKLKISASKEKKIIKKIRKISNNLK